MSEKKPTRKNTPVVLYRIVDNTDMFNNSRYYHVNARLSPAALNNYVGTGNLRGVSHIGEWGPYCIRVDAGELFDWDKDGVHDKVLSILREAIEAADPDLAGFKFKESPGTRI